MNEVQNTPNTSTQNISPEQKPVDEKQFALFVHLSGFIGFLIPFGNILVPLILWTIKRKESEYIDYHGKEVMNFQISVLIWIVISLVAMLLLVGFVMIIAVFFASIILPIIGGIAAQNGERYRYPFCFRFIK